MGMSVGKADAGGPMSEINTTPLIDVMLVLLIMFIVTLPPQRHAVKLDNPRPNPNQPLTEPPPPIGIDVEGSGTIVWNGEVVDRPGLEVRLKEMGSLPVEQQTELHIRPEPIAKYKDVAMVMAIAQRNGAVKIGVIGGVEN